MWGVVAHELGTINPLVILYKFIDVAVIHPLGDHGEPVSFHIHADKRQDVRVLQVPPGNYFSAKFLKISW